MAPSAEAAERSDMSEPINDISMVSCSSETQGRTAMEPITKTGEADQAMTFERLPLEIKNQIFSCFLLGKNVKYSTDGHWPGHKYKFDTTIMRTSKKLKEEATAYLYSHNDFALIHTKHHTFEISRERFLPTVATGRPAKSFKSENLSIEATIMHLGSRCPCIDPSCPRDVMMMRDKVRVALLLVQDLRHTLEQLEMTHHIWPTLPIVVISPPGSRPVTYTSGSVDTRTKVVWKVNGGRPDLTIQERRNRQTKLVAPLATLASHGQQTVVLGVDEDIATRAIQHIGPRIVWLDAIGWNLLDILRDQKQHLDNLLRQNPSDITHIRDGYMALASFGWELQPTPMSISKKAPGVSFVMKAISNGMEIRPLAYWSLIKRTDPDALRTSWPFGVIVTVLDCLFTVAGICRKEGQMRLLSMAVLLSEDVYSSAIFRDFIPAELHVLHAHYHLWVLIAESYDIETQDLYERCLGWLNGTELGGNELKMPLIPDEYLEEDMEFVRKVAHGKIQPSEDPKDFKGLSRRGIIQNTQVELKRPQGFRGWTTEKDHIGDELAGLIFKQADAGNSGQELRSEATTTREGHVCVGFINPRFF